MSIEKAACLRPRRRAAAAWRPHARSNPLLFAIKLVIVGQEALPSGCSFAAGGGHVLLEGVPSSPRRFREDGGRFSAAPSGGCSSRPTPSRLSATDSTARHPRLRTDLGPVFCNSAADEINRAPAKAVGALEVMQEVR